jgi:uncharacterized protein (TIGR03437 family)
MDPSIDAGAVLSAASFVQGPIAPGEIISVFGNNMGPPNAQVFAFDADQRIPVEVAGIQVLFNGVPGRVLMVSSQQVNVIAPYALDGQTSVQVMVKSHGQTSAPVTIQVAKSAPALFTLNASGTGQAAALNQDNSLNSAGNPAVRGSVIVLFGTGEGQTDPPGIDGQIATGSLPRPILPVQVFISETLCETEYAGAAPGEPSGVLQINARIPATLASGPQPVVIRIGDAQSPTGVSVAIS